MSFMPGDQPCRARRVKRGGPVGPASGKPAAGFAEPRSAAGFSPQTFHGRRFAMKHALFLSAAVAAALSLAACNKPASTTASDTTVAAGQAVNKAEDATGAAVGATSANTMGSHDTAAFVSNASQSDMYEIQAAQIAEKKSKNPDIKAFARMMVKDHTASSKAMTPLAQAAGQTPAADLDNRRHGFIDHLNAAPDADFDKIYADQQVAAHKEALDLLNGYAKDGPDPGLKDAAAKLVPTVQAHLDKITAIQASLKK
jgi:putative membrane protein